MSSRQQSFPNTDAVLSEKNAKRGSATDNLDQNEFDDFEFNTDVAMVQPSQFQTQDFAYRNNGAEPGKFTIQPNLMNEDELDQREDMDSSRNLSY